MGGCCSGVCSCRSFKVRGLGLLESALDLCQSLLCDMRGFADYSFIDPLQQELVSGIPLPLFDSLFPSLSFGTFESKVNSRHEFFLLFQVWHRYQRHHCG